MASVNPHWFYTTLSKKNKETTCSKLYAIVLYANASKNDLTAPILLRSGSLKKPPAIEPEMSKRTAIASFGSLVMTGLKFFSSMASYTF